MLRIAQFTLACFQCSLCYESCALSTGFAEHIAFLSHLFSLPFSVYRFTQWRSVVRVRSVAFVKLFKLLNKGCKGFNSTLKRALHSSIDWIKTCPRWEHTTTLPTRSTQHTLLRGRSLATSPRLHSVRSGDFSPLLAARLKRRMPLG